ncbi:MAG: hypothetical protein JAZ18_01820 [Candidatus Thiodiazotropha endolucinida]|nr:hypothetical protein [Candidatus Thiodiazotropha endolucinida]
MFQLIRLCVCRGRAVEHLGYAVADGVMVVVDGVAGQGVELHVKAADTIRLVL